MRSVHGQVFSEECSQILGFARVLPSNQKTRSCATRLHLSLIITNVLTALEAGFRRFHLTMFVALCSKVVLSAYSVLKAGFRRSI